MIHLPLLTALKLCDEDVARELEDEAPDVDVDELEEDQ